MTPELLTLADSVVALPGWRWMPGMLTRNGDRIKVAARYDDGRWRLDTSNNESIYNTGLDDAWKCNWYDIKTGRDREMAADAPLPDLTDAATGGCMLVMLGRCRAVPGPLGVGGVAVEVFDMDARMWSPEQRGATLAEACARVALARGRWA